MTPLAIAVVVSLVFSVAFVAGAAWATQWARRRAVREASVVLEGEAVSRLLDGEEREAVALRGGARAVRRLVTSTAWRGET